MAHHCSCQDAEKKISKTSVGVLEWPRYSPGLILEDSDLTAAVDYTRALNRLLFRSLFGCGVVCGLTVSVGTDCGLQVTVAPGLALDGCGDPLHLAGPVTLELGQREGVLPPQGVEGPPERTKEFWVVACAGEKQCAPRTLVCDGDDLDGTRQPTRTRAMTEISISFTAPQCVCGCKPPGKETDNGKREPSAKSPLRRRWRPIAPGAPGPARLPQVTSRGPGLSGGLRLRQRLLVRLLRPARPGSVGRDQTERAGRLDRGSRRRPPVHPAAPPARSDGGARQSVEADGGHCRAEPTGAERARHRLRCRRRHGRGRQQGEPVRFEEAARLRRPQGKGPTDVAGPSSDKECLAGAGTGAAAEGRAADLARRGAPEPHRQRPACSS